MKHYFSLLMLGVVLSSCGGSSGGEAAGDRTNGLEMANCQFSFYDGNIASDFYASYNNIRSFSFGKTLNYAHLQAIADASAMDTIRYFEENLNVEIYRSNDGLQGVGCANDGVAFFNDLKVAPNNLLNIWNRVNGDGGGGSLLGLYKPAGDDDINSYTKNSVIYVLPESARWTLIHEGIHHLFNRQRLKEGRPTDKAFWVDFRAAVSDYETKTAAVNSSTSSNSDYGSKLEAAVGSAEKTFPLLHEYMKRYSLEEATIEKLMIEKTDSREFSYVDGKARSGAIWYIQSSLGKAYELLEIMKDDLSKFKTNSYSASRTDLISRIDNLNSNVKSKNDKVMTLYRWAQINEKSLGHKSVVAGAKRSHHRCNHDHPEAEEVLLMLMKNRKLPQFNGVQN